MEDTIVSYETALLAKEVGFNEECLNFYVKPNSRMFSIDENGRYYPIKNISKKVYKIGQDATLNIKNVIYAPTQSLLSKWLREIHKIHVSVDFDSYLPDVPKYYAVVKSISSKNMGERLLDGFTLYSNYEEALEEGLFESLKLIIK